MRLNEVDIPRISSEIGVGEDEIYAFMDIEATGPGSIQGQRSCSSRMSSIATFTARSGMKRSSRLAFTSSGEKLHPKNS